MEIYVSEVYDVSLASATYANDGSEEYSHAESLVQSEQADATYCDDIPDLTDDISQAESLPLSEQETVIVLDTTASQDDSVLASVSDESEMMEKHGKNGVVDVNGIVGEGDLDDSRRKPALPKKPDLSVTSGHIENSSFAQKSSSKKTNEELVVSELLSESDKSEESKKEKEKPLNDRKHKLSSSSSSDMMKSEPPKPKERKSVAGGRKKEPQKDKNQNITYLKYDEAGNQSQASVLGEVSSQEKSEGAESTPAKNKRTRRKQGLTITDILDALDRSLVEEELWALCKEGTSALQRKKKHLRKFAFINIYCSWSNFQQCSYWFS